MHRQLKKLNKFIAVNLNQDCILDDHSYFKYSNTYCGGTLSDSTQFLITDAPYIVNRSQSLNEEMIDVVNIEEPLPKFETSYILKLFSNIEDEFLQCRQGDCEENWEKNLIKCTWSLIEVDFFDSLLNSLNNYKITTYQSSNLPNVYLEKCVQNFRNIFLKYNWDIGLIRWSHNIFIAYLPLSLLIQYVEILTKLSIKIPWLIFNMLNFNSNPCTGGFNIEHFVNEILMKHMKSFYNNNFNILKSCSKTNEDTNMFGNNEDIHRQYLKECSLLMRKKKIIVLCVPPIIYPNFLHDKTQSPNEISTVPWIYENSEFMERLNFWKTNLLPREWNLHIFKMKRDDITKNSEKQQQHPKEFEHNPLQYGLSLYKALKSKLKTLRKDHPDSFLILWGWNIGSLFSCYASLECPVDAIMCFGFPYIDMKERKPLTPKAPPSSSTRINTEENNNNGSFMRLDEVVSPIVYVIGQIPTDYSLMNLKMVEHLRARLQVPNALIVIGQSNDNLQLVDSKFTLTNSKGEQMPPLQLCQELADYFVSRAVLNTVYKYLLRHSKKACYPTNTADPTASSEGKFPTSAVKRPAPIPLKFNLKKGNKIAASFFGSGPFIADRYKANKRLKSSKEAKLLSSTKT